MLYGRKPDECLGATSFCTSSFLSCHDRMKSLLITLCFLSVAFLEASHVLEVSGHVGGQVSIPCFGSWNLNSTVYFCKGVCTEKNTLILTETKKSALTKHGRYSIKSADGVLTVTIEQLRRADAGTYLCKMRQDVNSSQQEVNLKVTDSSTVPPGAPPSTHPGLRAEGKALPQGGAEATSATPKPPLSNTKAVPKDTNSFTDTFVVIIVSGSLAFLVCAIIPLMFYRHWRSNDGHSRPTTNKKQDDGCEENTATASTQVSIGLQCLEQDHAESSADASIQYDGVYEGLDPKGLD